MYYLFEHNGDNECVARPYSRATAQDFIPILKENANLDSPILLVVVSLPLNTPLEGVVAVLSWEPVRWVLYEPSLDPDQG